MSNLDSIAASRHLISAFDAPTVADDFEGLQAAGNQLK